jgi:DHA2 family multidrug resistance protein
MQARESGRLGLILLTVCTMLATVMQALDSTIANVALPYMQGSMAASQDEINWVLTSYIVAAAIMTAPVGFLASKFGRKQLFIGSILGFTLASILCGAAQSLDQIVVFRILQGVCGAALVPLAQSIMFDLYPAEKRGAAMALWSMGVQLGPILGPILGGWLTENASWRWVFYVNVPFGIITVLGLAVFLKETPRSTDARLDWLGFGALSLAIGAFQLLLDRGEELDWFASPEIIVETCIAGLGLYVFLVQSALSPKPFISPLLILDRNFAICNIFAFIIGVTLYATLALLAPYLQTLMNYPVETAGIALAPRGAGTIIAALIAGRAINWTGPRPLMLLGFALSSYALYEIMHWTPDVSEITIVSVGVTQGLGLGFIFVTLSVACFSTLIPELRVQGTGVLSLMRNLGSSIGISVTGALLQTNTQVNHATIMSQISSFNRNLQTGSPSHFWNPHSPAGAGALNQVVTRQASIIGYSDDFKLMLVLTIFALPLVLLIRMPAVAPAHNPRAEKAVLE